MRQLPPRFTPPAVGASEKHLLRWLGAHPLLTADELKVLLGTRSHDADRLAISLVRKGLAACVERQAEAEAAVEAHYFLTGDGLELLARQDGVPPRRYLRHGPIAAAAPGWRGAGRLGTLTRQFEHSVGVNGFVVRLIDDARRCGLVVANWLSASEGAQRFTSGGTTHWLRPDSVLRVNWQGRMHRFYIKWDRGTMSRPEMMGKFQLYAQYYALLASMDSDSIPDLLVVTSSPHREEILRYLLNEALKDVHRPEANILTSVQSLVDRLGAFGEVWRDINGSRRRRWLC
jgi:hypothetical protein